MKLRLKGGDRITHKGADFIVSKNSALNARPVDAVGEEETTAIVPMVSMGNHQSDLPDPIDRTKIVSLFNDYLSKLEDHQSDLLRHEAFRDEELEMSEEAIGTHYKASIYAASVVYISELKTLIENIGQL